MVAPLPILFWRAHGEGRMADLPPSRVASQTAVCLSSGCVVCNLALIREHRPERNRANASYFV